MTNDNDGGEAAKEEQRQKLEQRLAAVRKRIDQAYIHKLDGRTSEDFWQRKTAEWQLEEQQVMMAMQGLQQASPDVLLTAKRTLELANKAYFLYLTQSPAEQVRVSWLRHPRVPYENAGAVVLPRRDRSDSDCSDFVDSQVDLASHEFLHRCFLQWV